MKTRQDNGPARELLDEMATWPIFDPHSHINPHSPAARHFDEVLGYHYYTELAHSAGMPADLVAPEVAPRERAKNLAGYFDRIDNTVQASWLLEIARTFHDFDAPHIGPDTIDALWDRADHTADGPAWDERVWHQSKLEAVFLTNEFDDRLEGWDTTRYVPCLRTDDLVLKLDQSATVQRLKVATELDIADHESLKQGLAILFERFVSHGAGACAISLPPDFQPARPALAASKTALRRALHGMDLRGDEQAQVRALIFWMITELCADFQLPFDLMIGPVRNVYPAGVAGGRDLFDRRVSLHDYRDLFNHFASVTFPVSTLSPDAGAELVAYSWILPNVLPMGHWWYSNIPAFIAADLLARVQAVPRTKLLGYYSDAYKLEFVLPKFNMFRRILADTLAHELILGRGWSQERTLELARMILRENPARIFRRTGT